jgi:hypothetical protein
MKELMMEHEVAERHAIARCFAPAAHANEEAREC